MKGTVDSGLLIFSYILVGLSVALAIKLFYIDLLVGIASLVAITLFGIIALFCANRCSLCARDMGWDMNKAYAMGFIFEFNALAYYHYKHRHLRYKHKKK